MINRTVCRAALMLSLSALAMANASAQATMDHSSMGHAGMAMAGTKADAMTEGEVKKVDLQAQTITLKHGPIKNLDMPGMTMAFKAKTPALLGKVKAGDKVKFSAEMPNGALTVTAIDVVK